LADERETGATPAWEPAATALRAALPLAQARGVAVGRDAHAAIDLHVAGDREGLGQLLTTILSRAVLDAARGAEVALVAVRPASGCLRYEVRGATKRATSPTAHRLAARLGARVDDGPPPGVEVDIAGSTREPAGGVPTEAASPRRPSDSGRAVVLCIDDDPGSARLLASVLARRPETETVFAEDGTSALLLVEDLRPDLVLLDLHLPDIAGIVVLDRLRAHPATGRTPIAILSADVLPGREEELLRAGADAFLAKPLDVTELLAAVDRLLAH
jgi:CheY-like chemotaxis protein